MDKTLVNELLTPILSAISGAVVAYVTKLTKDYISHPKKENLEGKWYSSYTEKENEIDRTEMVNIENTITGIKITTLGKKYRYVAEAEILDKVYLIGRWHSIEKSASNSGPFVLTITPKGNWMAGFYGGHDKIGANTWNAWCLAREEKYLPDAKNFLSEYTQLPFESHLNLGVVRPSAAEG